MRLLTVLALLIATQASAADYSSYQMSPGEITIAGQYAMARMAQTNCHMDNVRLNRAYFQRFADGYASPSQARKQAFAAAVKRAEIDIAAQIAAEGADDWCWDATSAAFWNYTNGAQSPIFYDDELGLFDGSNW